MIWQYGNYKFDCNLKPPTFHKFSEWKKDFFKLPNVTKYKVWLTVKNKLYYKKTSRNNKNSSWK